MHAPSIRKLNSNQWCNDRSSEGLQLFAVKL